MIGTTARVSFDVSLCITYVPVHLVCSNNDCGLPALRLGDCLERVRGFVDVLLDGRQWIEIGTTHKQQRRHVDDGIWSALSDRRLHAVRISDVEAPILLMQLRDASSFEKREIPTI